MNNRYNHYKEAEKLIGMLESSQLKGYAASLQEALDSGATGTEIFMALRWNLTKLLSDPLCTEPLRIKANILWEELNSALA